MNRTTVPALITPILRYDGIHITEQDLECLKPRKYLNDNIINFFLKYMRQTLLTDAQQKMVHICDTHFMAAMEKYDAPRMARWLKKLLIFDKHYIIIPVMLHEHWFLMILAHPNNVFVDVEPSQRPKLYTLDSMGVDYAKEDKAKLVKALVCILRSACIIEKGVELTPDQIPVIPRIVNEQWNSFDCGICLLTNAEQFLIDEFRLTPSTDDDKLVLILNQTRQKRAGIRRLIQLLSASQQIAEKHDNDRDFV